MENQYKIFAQAIKDYKDGNPLLLSQFISATTKVDGHQYYSCMGLIQNQRVMNMDVGDFYITGTLNIFLEALKKANKNDGNLSLSRRLSMKFLAEDPEEFKEYITLYDKKATNEFSYTLSSVLLSMNTGKPEKLWESFFFNFLDSLEIEEFTDKQIQNIAKNMNAIFDLDKSQHPKIMKAIEFDAGYPNGNVLEQFLNYVNDFDRFIIPRFDINTLGKNEEHEEKCRKIAKILQKVKLEDELTTPTKDLLTNKPKNKI